MGLKRVMKTAPLLAPGMHPPREPISHTLHPAEIVKDAHRQSAVIHWNHPGRSDKIWSEWYPAPGERALRGTGVDAWEHPIPEYLAWKADGLLPAMVGSTDTHGGIYAHSERTLVWAPSPQAEDVGHPVAPNPPEVLRRKAAQEIDGGDGRLYVDTSCKEVWLCDTR
jgi:hypothetical protein